MPSAPALLDIPSGSVYGVTYDFLWDADHTQVTGRVYRLKLVPVGLDSIDRNPVSE